MTARFHIQCQNIQIATLIIIITIYSNYLDSLSFLSDFRLYKYQKASDGEGFNYLKMQVNLQFSGIANPSQSTAFWCYCDYLHSGPRLARGGGGKIPGARSAQRGPEISVKCLYIDYHRQFPEGQGPCSQIVILSWGP
jgi:hypothetical protein